MSTNTEQPCKAESLTRSQIATLAGVSEPTVTAWIFSGELAAYDVSAGSGKNKCWRVLASDWEEFKLRRGNSGFKRQPEASDLVPSETKFF